jgi:hypothetical protein
MRGGLERIDSQKIPCFLEAIGENNIGFYEKFGFHVVEEIKFRDQKIWEMLRQP